jgi:hypothetical protein
MVNYDRAVDLWRWMKAVTVRDVDGHVVGLFPLAFIRARGGYTWGYVFSVIKMLVDIPEGSPGRSII